MRRRRSAGSRRPVPMVLNAHECLWRLFAELGFPAPSARSDRPHRTGPLISGRPDRFPRASTHGWQVPPTVPTLLACLPARGLIVLFAARAIRKLAIRRTSRKALRAIAPD